MMNATSKKLCVLLACLLCAALIGAAGVAAGRQALAADGQTSVTITGFNTCNDNIIVLDVSEPVSYTDGASIPVYLNGAQTTLSLLNLSASDPGLAGKVVIAFSKTDHRGGDAAYWHLRIPAGTAFGSCVLSEDYNLYNLRNVNGNEADNNVWIICGQEKTTPFSLTGITGYSSDHAGLSRWYIALGFRFADGTPANLVDLIWNYGIIYATANDDITGSYQIYGGSENNVNINPEVTDGTVTALGMIINWSVLGETSGQTGHARMFRLPCGTVWGGYHGAYRLTHDVWLFFDGAAFTFLTEEPQFIEAGAAEAIAGQSSPAGFSFTLAPNEVPADPNWSTESLQASGQEIKVNDNAVGNAILKKYLAAEYYADLARGGVTAQEGDHVRLDGWFRCGSWFFKIRDTAFAYVGGVWERVAPRIVISLNGTPVEDEVLAAEIGTERSALTATAGDFFDESIEVAIGIPEEALTGTVFAAGTFTITFTATDSRGYTTVIERQLKIADTVEPVITVTGLTTEYSEGETLVYEVSAADNIDGSVQVVLDAPEGMTDAEGKLLPGQWEIRFTATDSADNKAVSEGYIITVADITPPVVTFGETPALFEAGTAFDQAALLSALGAAASDNFDGSITGLELVVQQGAVENGVLQAGSWEVTVNAADAAGNTGSNTTTITVSDTIAPVITVGEATKINYSEGEAPAIIATASDLYEGNVEVTLTWPDGALGEDGTLNLGSGEWVVTLNAKDSAGNAAEEVKLKIFVTMSDSEAPVITIKGKTEYKVGEELALTATAVDDRDGVVQVSVSVPADARDADGKLVAGTWTITFTASDAAGNSDSKTMEITVTEKSTGCGSAAGTAESLICVLLFGGAALAAIRRRTSVR